MGATLDTRNPTYRRGDYRGISGRVCGRNWHEAREKSSRTARFGEGGLGHGVVSSFEQETTSHISMRYTYSMEKAHVTVSPTAAVTLSIDQYVLVDRGVIKGKLTHPECRSTQLISAV